MLTNVACDDVSLRYLFWHEKRALCFQRANNRVSSGMQSAEHGGGCVCGQVRYTVNADPFIVTVCHCRSCQKASGSAFVIEPLFDRSNLSVAAGETSVYRHVSSGSGSASFTNFCANCGTRLFTTFERWPEDVSVAGGTFDDPGWFDLDPNTAQYIFLSEARRGTMIPAGARTFPGHCVGPDGAALEPEILQAARVLE